MDDRMRNVRRLIDAGRLREVDDVVALGRVAQEELDERAIPLYHHALTIARGEDHRLALLVGLANAHRNLGQFDESWQFTEETYRRAPYSMDVRKDRAFALLLQRRYQEAWPESDFRFLDHDKTRQFPYRGLWDGRSTGQRIFISIEQALGDQIQMIRFIQREPLASNTLFLECHAALYSLFSRLPNIARLFRFSDPTAPPPLSANDIDCHIPYMSLPGRFNAAYDAGLFTGPYIRYDLRQRDWPSRIPGDKIRIGLVWQGDRGQQRDRYRSIPLRLLDPLFLLDGIQFYSLAVDRTTREELYGSEAFRQGRITDLGDRLTDFDQTASALANLDRLITVDTAVAHLAGAMGLEVWTLLSKSCDWRWGLDGETTHWYPSMTLFRQGDLNRWEPVIECVRDRLARR
jgi:hypothetical protein